MQGHRPGVPGEGALAGNREQELSPFQTSPGRRHMLDGMGWGCWLPTLPIMERRRGCLEHFGVSFQGYLEICNVFNSLQAPCIFTCLLYC